MAEDLLQGLKDVISETTDEKESSDSGFKMPSVEDILKAIDQMPLSEGEKEKIKRELGEGMQGMPGAATESIAGASNPWLEFLALIGLVGFIIMILGFIGYKLYFSVIERESRKEQKRLEKAQKKTK